jgi:hypothetical protein
LEVIVLDTSVDAYIAAYQRQDQATCMAIACAIRASAEFVRRDCWVNSDPDQKDVSEYRFEMGDGAL